MAVDKFKFVSPGIFIDEIDESIITPLPERMGPLIIGRFAKGPSNRPTTVDSFKDLVARFGAPHDGNHPGDSWRSNAPTAPTYAAYAAQAWLKNNSPCTIYRVLGENASNASAGNGQAGWKLTNTFSNSAAIANNGGAYGLIVYPSGSTNTSQVTGTLAAIWYVNEGAVLLQGALRGAGDTSVTHAGALVKSSNGQFTAVISGSTGVLKTATFDFNKSSKNFIRKVFNTDATLLNSELHSVTEKYFLGETFESNIISGQNSELAIDGTPYTGSALHGAIVALDGTGESGIVWADHKKPATAAQTGWFISQGMGGTANFDPSSDTYVEKLFKFHALDSGEHANSDYKISIQDIKPSQNEFNNFGTFTVLVRKGFDTDQNPAIIERYSNVNLNPKSLNFIERVIGDRFLNYDSDKKVIKELGNYPNRSSIIRVEVSPQVRDGKAVAGWLPFGVRGPVVPATLKIDRGTDTIGTTGWVDGSGSLSFDTLNANHLSGDILLVGDPAEDTKSTATLQVVSITPSQYDAGTFTLTDTAGTSKTYIFDDDNDGATGTTDGSSNVRIQIQGLSTNTGQISDQIKAAIEHANGHNGTITVTQANKDAVRDEITLTQAVGGTAGDRAISRAVVTDNGVYTLSTTFGGGANGLNFTSSLVFPKTRLRLSSSEGDMVKPTKAYFGYQSNLINTKRFDETNVDLLRAGPAGLDQFAKGTQNEFSWVFTLDDLVGSPTDAAHVFHSPGSRKAGLSLTALSGSTFVLTGSSGGRSFAFNRFTSPLFGGFDGFDIKEKDPLRNKFIEGGTERSNYAYYSLKKAIDVTSDPEFVEFDVAVMPGITNSSLNTQLISSCEERGDALAIVDLKGNYIPPEHSNLDEKDRLGSVDEVVTSAKDLGLNTSYGCTFYPYVQIRDTLSDSVLYVPPSVVALGTFSSSQRRSAVWFAPAGFTRGGLSEGSAGLPVIGVRERLTSDDRDNLYDVNINPIASFPAEGIVIFGQKTLQVTPSALDRINVRRLLIFVKKEISRIAATTLFEQNVSATWDRFKGSVIPFLEEVQAGLGLTDFRVILDETTTTPDLIDRNILYAKIFLKPARAIEFIALDFIITKSGASFDD